MKSRVCPGCGWEFPSSFVSDKCKFCKTLFDTQICLYCEEQKPTEEFTFYNTGRVRRTCRKCRSTQRMYYDNKNKEAKRERTRRHRERRRIAAEKMYEEWLDKTNIPFKPMTEQQWLNTCQHFGGCAICGNEHIETRQFMVGFEEGGKYAVWNIFPMCGNCSVRVRTERNPFKWLDGGARDYGLTDERKEKLLEYFISQIEKAGKSNDQ